MGKSQNFTQGADEKIIAIENILVWSKKNTESGKNPFSTVFYT